MAVNVNYTGIVQLVMHVTIIVNTDYMEIVQLGIHGNIVDNVKIIVNMDCEENVMIIVNMCFMSRI